MKNLSNLFGSSVSMNATTALSKHSVLIFDQVLNLLN